METLTYLGKAGLIYAGLYLIYFGLFRKNTNFQSNRIYLLIILPLAFLLPIINTNVEIAAQYQITLPAVQIGDAVVNESTFDWSNLFINFYLIVSAILFGLLSINIIKILSVISKIKKGRNINAKPFSFFSFIYVSNNIDKGDRASIINHEKIHSTQLHSFDIIVYELCKIILWWNPFIWMGLNSVKSNHEFIADKLASVKANKYSSVLVAQLLGVNCSVLANNFKYKPLIKKRIMMMKTKRSKRLSILKYALVIPVIGLTLVASTTKETAEKTLEASRIGENVLDSVYTKADKMPEFKGGTDALMKFLGSNITYPEEAKKNKIEGIVYVGFIIDKKGNVKDITAVKEVNPLLDAEAIRVIKDMPNWKPGKNKGKKVSVKYFIPINFKLKE